MYAKTLQIYLQLSWSSRLVHNPLSFVSSSINLTKESTFHLWSKAGRWGQNEVLPHLLTPPATSTVLLLGTELKTNEQKDELEDIVCC